MKPKKTSRKPTRERIVNPKKSLEKTTGKNGILLFVCCEPKGLLDEF
jgi:hypothetical protein